MPSTCCASQANRWVASAPPVASTTSSKAPATRSDDLMLARNATARFIGVASGGNAGWGSPVWVRLASEFQQPMILAASSRGSSRCSPATTCCIGPAICSSVTISTITL
ncbi:Uncharacterised protein [Mycobacteroides abscessus subsp. abscessus]|nr:Uncharacterised protein [Mycobacteroides abscessus subsp. abscessus]